MLTLNQLHYRSLRLSLMCLFCLSVTGAGAQFAVFSEFEQITVASVDSYRTNYEIKGVNGQDVATGLVFSLTQTEKLEDIQTTITANGKTKKIDPKKNMSVSTMDWSAFFTGSTSYRIQIPANCSFTVTYSTTNTHTLFLSDFHRHGGYNTANYTCSLSLPADMQLTVSNGKVYTGAIVLDSLDFPKGQDRLFCLAHPKETDPETYFSRFFEKYLDTLTTLDGQTMPEELEKLSAAGKRDELAAACFNYVQDKIAYIDIENGINAFVPRPAGKTLSTGLGDCKDMANLLCALLRHYKFESYLGISRTNSRKDTFNFPSIALGNHMIVALKQEDRFVFLDATEDECAFGDPSYQILGTEAFLIGNKSGYFQNVESTLNVSPVFAQSYNFVDRNSKVAFQTTIEIKGKLNLLFDMLHNAGKVDAATVKRVLRNVYKFDIDVDSLISGKQSTLLVLSGTVPQSAVLRLPGGLYLDFNLFPSISDWSEFLSGTDKPPYAATYSLALKHADIPSKLSSTENMVLSASPEEFKIGFLVDAKTLSGGEISNSWKQITAKPILLHL